MMREILELQQKVATLEHQVAVLENERDEMKEDAGAEIIALKQQFNEVLSGLDTRLKKIELIRPPHANRGGHNK